MAATTFADISKSLPFRATTKEGRGFLPPFLRAMNHFLTIMQFVEESKKKDKMPFVIEELKEAVTHITAINVGPFLSSTAKETLINFGKLAQTAHVEASSWTEDQIVENCKILMDRGAMVASMLDRELIGLSDSDPGSQI